MGATRASTARRQRSGCRARVFRAGPRRPAFKSIDAGPATERQLWRSRGSIERPGVFMGVYFHVETGKPSTIVSFTPQFE